MSTTPEVIVARHMEVPCFALSVITGLGIEGKIKYTTHKSVRYEAEKVESSIAIIMTELISAL
jgi:purine-nucleoside phosphorylase